MHRQSLLLEFDNSSEFFDFVDAAIDNRFDVYIESLFIDGTDGSRYFRCWVSERFLRGKTTLVRRTGTVWCHDLRPFCDSWWSETLERYISESNMEGTFSTLQTALKNVQREFFTYDYYDDSFEQTELGGDKPVPEVLRAGGLKKAIEIRLMSHPDSMQARLVKCNRRMRDRNLSGE